MGDRTRSPGGYPSVGLHSADRRDQEPSAELRGQPARNGEGDAELGDERQRDHGQGQVRLDQRCARSPSAKRREEDPSDHHS
jgi:hypothetical protein